MAHRDLTRNPSVLWLPHHVFRGSADNYQRDAAEGSWPIFYLKDVVMAPYPWRAACYRRQYPGTTSAAFIVTDVRKN
jgi:hypothetical protein